MARVIVLDSSPLGLASGPRGDRDVRRCVAWILSRRWSGALIVAPEVADYEVRRGLLASGLSAGVRRLDLLLKDLVYAPITRPAMRRAADYWAHVRQAGLPTAHPHALDADCIVAAQAVQACGGGDVMTIATSNVRHIARFPGIDARPWESITE